MLFGFYLWRLVESTAERMSDDERKLRTDLLEIVKPLIEAAVNANIGFSFILTKLADKGVLTSEDLADLGKHLDMGEFDLQARRLLDLLRTAGGPLQ